MTCAQLRAAAPAATWVRVSGCRVLYGSISFVRKRGRLRSVVTPDARGTVTQVLFPLVDPAEPSVVPIVVASRDQATLDEVARTIDAPAGGTVQAVLALYNVARPIESAPIEGVIRHGLFAGEGRKTIEDIGAPLASDFMILDLGATPSVLRSALFIGGGLVSLVLFVFTLVATRRVAEDAGAGTAPPSKRAGTPGGPPGLPPAIATKPIGVARLMLLNVGPTATAEDVEHAPPLGTRTAVEATIAELLPGTAFDESGRGEFARSDYSIAFELGSSDEVQTAIVGARGQPAIVAIRRLLRKTGWRLYAPQQGNFVEPETLGGLMASGPAGPKPEALRVRTERRPLITAWTRTSAAGARYALLAVVLFGFLVWGLWGTFSSPQDEAIASQEQVIEELIAVGRANLALHVMSGSFTSPEQLADPVNAPRLGAAALPALFATPVRHGYRFAMRGQPASPADAATALLEPAFASFVYTATPVNDASLARSFAFLSDRGAVYAALARVPTQSDQLVRTIQ